MYLLAYAASVCEGCATNRPIKDELKATMQAIEKVHFVCSRSTSSSELIAELPALYHCIRFLVHFIILFIYMYIKISVLMYVCTLYHQSDYDKTAPCSLHLIHTFKYARWFLLFTDSYALLLT